MRKNKQGFTLVELLIVMAVVAILVAIIIPSFRGMQEEGWITKAEAEVQTLQTAVESYYRHNGSYPENLAALLTARPQIIYKELEDPWRTSGDTYGYRKGDGADSDPDFGDWYIIYSKSADGTENVTWDADANTVTKSNGVSANDIAASNAPISF